MSWGFINPWALLALGALTLPLAIHLLNRHRGRLVYVGNIALYRQPRRQRLLAVRLQQPGLLALRLLILSLLALLMAGFYLVKQGTLSGNVAYVTPQWWQLSDAEVKTHALDSHDKLFFLVPGFPEVTADSAATPTQTSDVCSLLIERTARQLHSEGFAVYAVNKAGQLPSTLCALGSAVSWHWLSDSTDTARLPSIDVSVFYTAKRADDAYAFEAALALIDELRAVRVRATLQQVSDDATAGTPMPLSSPLTEQIGSRRIVVGMGVTIADATADLMLTDRLPMQFPENPRAHLDGSEVIAFDPETLATASTPFGAVMLLHDSPPELGAAVLFIEHFHADAGGALAVPDFPDRLLPWLIGAQLWQRSFEHLAVAPEQVLARPAQAQLPLPVPMTYWLSALVVLLLLLERLWSEWYLSGKRQ